MAFRARKVSGTFEKRAPGRPDLPVRKCTAASVLLNLELFVAKLTLLFTDEQFGYEQFSQFGKICGEFCSDIW